MALRKEPVFSPEGNTHPSPYRPLALSPWEVVFDQYGNLTDLPAAKKYTSRDLATQVGENSVARLQREIELRGDKSRSGDLGHTALLALYSTITGQSSRNSRYDTPETQARIRESYPDDADKILYGAVTPEVLAKTLIENDDLITSLEVARYTHLGQWQLAHNINKDVPAALASAKLGAEELSDEPRYKIKSFELSERWVLAERKRRIMSLMGGEALLVMRLNFLIDCESTELDPSVAQHIKQERQKQFERGGKGYDFNAENELLLEEFDDNYVRSANEVDFIVPIQTGHYVYSPAALELEKERQAIAEVQRQKNAAKQREFFASLV